MGILKTTKDVLGILARDIIGKALLAVGITGLIGGSIVVPIIVLNVARAFESTREMATILTAIAASVTFLVSLVLTLIGGFLLYRGRES